LDTWFGGRLVWLADDGDLFKNAHTELATAPFTSIRECYLGDVRSCATALGVTQPDDSLTAWYDNEDRMKVVDRLWGGWHPPPEGTRECLEGVDHETCVSLIRRRWRVVPPPMSAAARRTLARVALELGGEGGHERLIDSTVISMEQRLASVAAVAPDSLIAAWRTAVLAARPTAAKVTRRLGWTTFFWVFAFFAVASRSSRWR
jgi:hypothetical protein